MNDGPAAFLSSGRQDFFDQFKSFWAAPSGLRVPELIAPDATIHFTGAGTFSGHEYIDVMDGMLATMDDLVVTPLDCAGHGDRLYMRVGDLGHALWIAPHLSGCGPVSPPERNGDRGAGHLRLRDLSSPDR